MAEISVLIQMNSPLDRCGVAAAVEVEAGRMTRLRLWVMHVSAFAVSVRFQRFRKASAAMFVTV